DNEEWLMTLEEGVLETLEPTEEEEKPKEPATPTEEELKASAAAAEAKAKTEAEAEAKATEEKPKEPATLESYIEQAPAEIQDVLGEGVRLQRERKDALIKALKGNDRCDYTEKELEAHSIRDLEKLAKLAKIPTFIGNTGAGLQLVGNTEEDNTPPKVFEGPAAAS
ncbi:hypothetical protein LCGC14_2796590, partial [marine sediment metagenome]